MFCFYTTIRQPLLASAKQYLRSAPTSPRLATLGSRTLTRYPHPFFSLQPHEMVLSPKLSTPVDNFQWKTLLPVENLWTLCPCLPSPLSGIFYPQPGQICYTISIQPLEHPGSFEIQRCMKFVGSQLFEELRPIQQFFPVPEIYTILRDACHDHHQRLCQTKRSFL